MTCAGAEELEALIAQQAREMRFPWRTFHWSKRSVAATLSLDHVIGHSQDGSLTVGDVLVEGETAWLPWAFAPIRSLLEPGDRALGVTDALSVEERGLYYAEWAQS